MKKWMIMGCVALCGILDVLAQDAAEVAIGSAAPAFEGTDTQGNTVKLSDYAGKLVVLEWTNPDCPFVKKHYGSHNMQNLQKKFTDKGVVWLTVCSSAPGKQGNYDAATWNKMIGEKGIAATAVLLDAEGKIGHAYGAKNTPHMIIIGKDGTLLFKGGIDNKPSTEPEDIVGAYNYVEHGLDEALEGKALTHATAKPYGCGVKY